MKTFDDLSEKEQEKAINYCLKELLDDLVSGSIRFNDEVNQDTLQADIDKAAEKATKNQVPWFIGEYILENNSTKKCLYGIATCSAQDAMYSERNEYVIPISQIK